MKFIYFNSNYFFKLMSNEQIHDMLLYACRKCIPEIIEQNQAILPDYIIIRKDNQNLVTALVSNSYHSKIDGILYNTLNFDQCFKNFDLTLLLGRMSKHKEILRKYIENPE